MDPKRSFNYSHFTLLDYFDYLKECGGGGTNLIFDVVKSHIEPF